MSITDLPAWNAGLNSCSAIMLAAGYRNIRQKNIPAHRACMIAAFIFSSLFFASYVIYHYHAGSVPFQRHGWIRPVYFTVLISHVTLAAVILPLALITLYRALRQRFDQHGRIARWTWPIWMYVSVTGVVVYLMLYRL